MLNRINVENSPVKLVEEIIHEKTFLYFLKVNIRILADIF